VRPPASSPARWGEEQGGLRPCASAARQQPNPRVPSADPSTDPSTDPSHSPVRGKATEPHQNQHNLLCRPSCFHRELFPRENNLFSTFFFTAFGSKVFLCAVAPGRPDRPRFSSASSLVTSGHAAMWAGGFGERRGRKTQCPSQSGTQPVTPIKPSLAWLHAASPLLSPSSSHPAHTVGNGRAPGARQGFVWCL